MDFNPLKQYFRRPAVYIKLPSQGKFYSEGVVENTPDGQLPVYPMTAIDEITLKTPDALFNGVAMSEIIKSCVPNIKDPWSINNVDFDAILIGIKIADGKEEMEVDSGCPSCNEINTYSINLPNLLVTMDAGDFDKEMDIHDLKIKLKPLTFKQMNAAAISQLSVQRKFAEINAEKDEEKANDSRKELLKELTTLTMELLTESIEYIQTPTVRVDNKEFIFDFLKNCDKNTYTTVRDYNIELKSKSEVKPMEIICPNCKHQYKQPFTLNASDFFG